jgi:hypothetical protein
MVVHENIGVYLDAKTNGHFSEKLQKQPPVPVAQENILPLLITSIYR